MLLLFLLGALDVGKASPDRRLDSAGPTPPSTRMSAEPPGARVFADYPNLFAKTESMPEVARRDGELVPGTQRTRGMVPAALASEVIAGSAL